MSHPEHVSFVMGDTATTPDQGGVGGSTSIMLGLETPAQRRRHRALSCFCNSRPQRSRRRSRATPGSRNGVISVKGDDSKNVSYGDARRRHGSRRRSQSVRRLVSLSTSKVLGKPKDPSTYTVVGQSGSARRHAGQDFTVSGNTSPTSASPDMLHGRVMRPAGVGAKLVSVDEIPSKSIPGYVQAVVKGNFVGVVAENEWAAIQAAKQLKVTWSAPAAAFPEQKDLTNTCARRPRRPAPSRKTPETQQPLSQAQRKKSKPDTTSLFSRTPPWAQAAPWPMSISTVLPRSGPAAKNRTRCKKASPNCCGVPLDQVRVIWVEDAGSYGRPGFEDAAADAILLSREVGKPVRVQWMRADMTSWGTKGPAVACDLVRRARRPR